MIPLSVPTLAGNEWDYVKECLDTGWVSSAGKYVDRFETEMAEFVGARHAVATVNGTAALQIAMIVAGCDENDAILLPNLTFVASANAISYVGAEQIFVDVDPVHWQMDLDLLEQFLSGECTLNNGQTTRNSDGKRIRFIMPVHTLGDMGDMDRLLALASKYGLRMIEDSTEALGTSYNGKHAGLFGELGTFSFNGNKVISTGGGGIIVTDDEAKAKLAKHLTTQAKVPGAGYFHDMVGYNHRLVNVLAAIGVAQLEQLPGFLKHKRAMATLYRQKLSGIGDIRFPEPVAGVQNNAWLNTFHTAQRDKVLEVLSEAGVEARPFWVPMNQLPMHKGRQYVTNKDIAGSMHDGCVSIPSSASLTEEQLSAVCDAVASAY